MLEQSINDTVAKWLAEPVEQRRAVEVERVPGISVRYSLRDGVNGFKVTIE